LKKVCLNLHHQRNMDLENTFNCVEKAKHAMKLLEKIQNKIY
jgi:hypothetical protein